MSRQYFVYVLGNFKRTVLYIGVTGNLIRRVWEHKNDIVAGFSQKYRVHDLLYYEVFPNPTLAIEREKQLKRWNREKKNNLIVTFNPTLIDLYSTII